MNRTLTSPDIVVSPRSQRVAAAVGHLPLLPQGVLVHRRSAPLPAPVAAAAVIELHAYRRPLQKLALWYRYEQRGSKGPLKLGAVRGFKVCALQGNLENNNAALRKGGRTEAPARRQREQPTSSSYWVFTKVKKVYACTGGPSTDPTTARATALLAAAAAAAAAWTLRATASDASSMPSQPPPTASLQAALAATSRAATATQTPSAAAHATHKAAHSSPFRRRPRRSSSLARGSNEARP